MNLRRRRVILAIAAPVAFGLVSLALGRDVNWDLRNYHWYNPYALLADRSYLDVAPAGLQSFFIPLLDIPWFALGRAVPGVVVGFLLAAVQSLNLILLYFLAYRLLPFEDMRRRNTLALWVAFAGMCGGGSLGLLGTTFQDNIVSIGVLGSLLAVVTSEKLLTGASSVIAGRGAALAAIPIGLAVAGKVTTLPYAVGLTAAFLFWPGPPRRRVLLTLCFGAGFSVVLAAVYGPWMWHLWNWTGNPFFPFLDFPGARLAAAPYSFTHFVPRGWLEAVAYPLVFSLDPLRVGENDFRDYRIATAYVVVPLCLIAAWRWPSTRAVDAPRSLGYVVAAFAIGYALWLVGFSIYRYAVTLEMLAPLVIAMAIAALPFAARARSIALRVLLLVLLVTAWPSDWGRGRWTGKFIEVEAPSISHAATTLVLLLDKPLAYVVPAFPAEVAFIQLVPELAPLDAPGAAWNRMVRARLDQHTGEMFGLMRATRNLYKQSSEKQKNARRLLSAYGLRMDEQSCRPVPSNLDQAESLTLCDAYDWLGLRREEERCHPADPGPEIAPEICRVVRAQ
jgi:hypothetical protein